MTKYALISPIIAEIGTNVVSAEKLTGGFSHESWLVQCSDGQRVVVRFGEASSAVEAAVLTLAKTVVPVPTVLASGDGYSVLEYIEGQNLEEALRNSGDHEDFNDLAAELGRIVASVGKIEFAQAGFFENENLLLTSEEPWSQQLTDFCAVQLAASDRLSPSEIDDWLNLTLQSAASLEAIDSFSRLVHSDMNPKNIIVDRATGSWRVAAIIDWEFAYSGCPFADVGNFCRFNSDYPAGFLAGFVESFKEFTPQLTDQWRLQARILDMFSLSALAAKPQGNRIGDKAAARVRAWIANGIPPLDT